MQSFINFLDFSKFVNVISKLMQNSQDLIDNLQKLKCLESSFETTLNELQDYMSDSWLIWDKTINETIQQSRQMKIAFDAIFSQ